MSTLEYPAIAKLGQFQCSLGRHEAPSRLILNVSCRQEQKKPTWLNTRRRSATSAYSSTNPPAKPSCSSSSHPTTTAHYTAWNVENAIAPFPSPPLVAIICSVLVRTKGEIPMKTQGEIEAAISEAVSRFEQDHMGRGPKAIHAHLLGDFLVVRLQGVLTAAEQHLVKSLPAEKGRDLLKQVRTHLIETARPIMQAMVEKVTGVKVVTLHHDISTITGEEVVLFTLAESPMLRDAKKK